jgi:hypothetical protein
MIIDLIWTQSEQTEKIEWQQTESEKQDFLGQFNFLSQFLKRKIRRGLKGVLTNSSQQHFHVNKFTNFKNRCANLKLNIIEMIST